MEIEIALGGDAAKEPIKFNQLRRWNSSTSETTKFSIGKLCKTSSAQSLCIFCACRLTGDVPAILTPAPAAFATSKRRLNTTRPPNQSAAATAAAETPSNSDSTERRQWTGFDPSSSLTASEQRERAALRERREAQERQRHEAAEAQRRQREEADRVIAEQRRAEREARDKVQREEQAKIAESWRQEQAGAQREAEAKAKRVQRNLDRDRRDREDGNVFRKFGVRQAREDNTTTGPLAQRQQQQRGGGWASTPPTREARQPAQPQRRDNPSAAAQSTPSNRGARLPQRVAMPAFGASSNTGKEQDVRAKESGWGAGPVERAPLKHGEEVTSRMNANISEVVEPQRRSEDALREDGGWGRPSVQREDQTTDDLFGSASHKQQDRFADTRLFPQAEQEAYSRPSSQQQSRTEPTRSDNDFSRALSSVEGGRNNHSRQRGGFSSAGALDAAFEGSGQSLRQRAGQRQATPLGRDPLGTGVDMARQRDSIPAQYERRNEELERTPRSQPQQSQDQYRFRPSGEWAEKTSQAPSKPVRDSGWTSASEDIPDSNMLYENTEARTTGQEEHAVPYRPQQRSQNTDTMGSYQPPPPPRPPRQYDQSRYNDSGYQATLFDPQEDHHDDTRSGTSSDEDQTANWQHLRRRNSAPPPSQQTAYGGGRQQEQRQQQQRQLMDDEWIDRKFEAHRQQRTTPPYIASPFEQNASLPAQPTPEFNPRLTGAAANRRCGRCGEPGHLARECNGPIRAKCNICGQVGHFGKTCPQNNSQNPTSSRQRQQEGSRYNQRREEDRFAGRTGRGGPGSDEQVNMMMRRTQSEGHSESPFGVREPSRSERDAEGEWVDSRAHARRRFDADMEGERAGRRVSRSNVEEGERGSRGAKRAFGDEEDALSDMRDRVLRPQPARNEDAEEDEQPEERVLRSRKFTEDAPAKKDKASRGGRRRDEDDDEDDESGAARDERNARKAARKADKENAQADRQAKAADRKAKQAEARTQLKLPDFVSVATLAQTLGVRYEAFVSRLERLGYDDVFPGKVLNAETSGMIAMEYDYEPVFESTSPAEAEERDLRARPEVEDQTFLPTRPPVVTIMGHVDHGKTTILDYLRKSSVAAGEAGGITQHIGAFSVPLASSGKTITFLDTPGHAAFLAMRQRGAHVTDIVILVVAADDSVKPQTLEAIKHAQAANVPMIVAVNKIDKEEADLQRVKQDLARHGVELEDFGGETQVVPVSGKTGQGMEELEENVVTLSEILDHRAETDGAVEGWVLEATTKKAGRVATVLVRRGTLRPGTIIVAGLTWARVRTLRNEAGQTVREVGPGMPVEVDGWRDQPAAGDEVLQAGSEQKATDVVEYRVEKEEREKTAQDMEAINTARRLEQEKREKEKLAERAKKSGDTDYFEAAARADEENATNEDQQSTTGQMTIPFIIKADVSGSAEAVSAYILSISSPLIAPRILRSQVGALNESDVELAAAAEGHIIAFNLPADEGMKGAAEVRGVKVLENNIIYRVLDDVKMVLEAKLPPIVTQRVLGEAEVSAAFEIGVGGRKSVKIAGCKVRNGVVGRGVRVRVTRGSERIYDGTITSLKNVKKDVQEMRKGTECGMGFEGWEAFEVGDLVQTYEEVREKRRL